MTKFNVHLFREMRLYFTGIEAETAAEAAKLASDTDSCEADDIEDCNGTDLGAMVDIDGNADFAKSKLIDFEAQRLLNVGPKLLAALKAILPYAENELISLLECESRDGGMEEEVAVCTDAVDQASRVIEQAEGRVALATERQTKSEEAA